MIHFSRSYSIPKMVILSGANWSLDHSNIKSRHNERFHQVSLYIFARIYHVVVSHQSTFPGKLRRSINEIWYDKKKGEGKFEHAAICWSLLYTHFVVIVAVFFTIKFILNIIVTLFTTIVWYSILLIKVKSLFIFIFIDHALKILLKKKRAKIFFIRVNVCVCVCVCVSDVLIYMRWKNVFLVFFRV